MIFCEIGAQLRKSKYYDRRVSSAGRFAFSCCADRASFVFVLVVVLVLELVLVFVLVLVLE